MLDYLTYTRRIHGGGEKHGGEGKLKCDREVVVHCIEKGENDDRNLGETEADHYAKGSRVPRFCTHASRFVFTIARKTRKNGSIPLRALTGHRNKMRDTSFYFIAGRIHVRTSVWYGLTTYQSTYVGMQPTVSFPTPRESILSITYQDTCYSRLAVQEHREVT